MKRLIAYMVILMALMATATAHGSIKGQIFQSLLSGLRFDGSTLASGKVYFYSPGTTTYKKIYLDRNKQSEALNPYTLNANGQAELFGDGVYDIVVKTSGGSTKATWEGVSLQDISTTVDNGANYDSLNAVITAVGSTPTRLLVNSALPLTGNAIVPATLELEFTRAGRLTLNGYTLTGLKEARPEWFGAGGEGLTDDTIPLQAAHDALVTGGTLITAGIYKTAGLRITNYYFKWQGQGEGKVWDGFSQIRPRDSTQQFLVKWDNLSTSLKIGGLVENIIFNGSGATFTDAMVVCEGFAAVRFKGVGFHNAVGSALRLKVWWEGVFDDCMFRGNDASSATSMIYIDAGYMDINAYNVNNLTFKTCHFERNKGIWVASHVNANLDILRFIDGCKFEWGWTDPFVGGPWPVISLASGWRVLIQQSHFTNFNFARGYDRILDQSAGSVIMTGNSISGNSFAGTYMAKLSGTVGAIIKDNDAILPGDVTSLALSNTSNVAAEIHLPKVNGSFANLLNTSPLVNDSGPWLISAHKLGYINNRYATDVGTVNPQQTAYVESGVNSALILPLSLFKDSRSDYRITLRARSATGAGKVNFQVKTTLLGVKTVPATYGTSVFWMITRDQLAALGDNVDDRLKITTDATNAEAVYFDGIYIIPMPTDGGQFVSTKFNEVIANGATTTFTLPNDVNVNRRGLYMTYADSAGASYCLFHSDGSAITPISVGGNFTCQTTNANTAGKFNLYLSSGSIAVNNQYGSDRKVAVIPFGFR